MNASGVAALFPLSPSVVTAWLVVNVLDTLLTCVALSMGATEMSLTYRLTHSILGATALKYLAVILVVGLLARLRRLEWLNWLVGSMLLVLAWNATQILTNL